MSTWRSRVVICGALLSVACNGSADPRNHHDFERMRRQMRYESYGASSRFADGASMQAPPPHTVSIEAARALADSLPSDSSIASGRRQYAISCAACHGAAGFGGGPIAPNLTEKRPASLRAPSVASAPGSKLFAVITDGVGAMPPLGWQLAPRERWAIVAYVRSLASVTATDSSAIADSTLAAYLHSLDSLHAAHAPIRSILRLNRPGSTHSE